VTETRTDYKGREKKIYGQYATPYEKLKEVSKQTKRNYLKKDVTFENLDHIAYAMSDNEFAKKMRKQQYTLFDTSAFLKSL